MCPEQWEGKQHCTVIRTNVTDGVRIRSSVTQRKFFILVGDLGHKFDCNKLISSNKNKIMHLFLFSQSTDISHLLLFSHK